VKKFRVNVALFALNNMRNALHSFYVVCRIKRCASRVDNLPIVALAEGFARIASLVNVCMEHPNYQNDGAVY